MRSIFLLFILAGAALAGVYPWYVNNFSGREIGTVTVYERPGGFRPVTVQLDSDLDPVRVLVDLHSRGPANFSGSIAMLNLTVSTAGETVLTDRMTFAKSIQRDQSPQALERVFRVEAGQISPVKDADYVFDVVQLDRRASDFSKVDIVLRANALSLDPRAQPLGFGLAGFGLFGFIIASRSRRKKSGGKETPPPAPRWGRNGIDR